MEGILHRQPWRPSWIDRLDTAAWVRAPDGEITFVNRQARELLGKNLCLTGASLRACDARGAGAPLVCRERCPVLDQVARGGPVAPLELPVSGPDGDRRWVQVFSLFLIAPDGSGPWLVHWAVSIDRRHRFDRYLKGVLRNEPRERRRWSDRLGRLTPREQEVLDLLCRGADLRAIAARLHVSYATVRNHVHHILGKLEVHSIAQAVAVGLMSADAEEESAS